jgi:hypothetical protein
LVEAYNQYRARDPLINVQQSAAIIVSFAAWNQSADMGQWLVFSIK